MSKLQFDHLEKKIEAMRPLRAVTPPATGWIKAIRTTLGMTLDQLGVRLGVTKQSAQELEAREQEGKISLRSLREAAAAMDLELVYGLVPKDGSMHALIERRARKLAEELVSRTSNTMKLEDQENSQARIKEAIEERVTEFKQDLPKALWD